MMADHEPGAALALPSFKGTKIKPLAEPSDAILWLDPAEVLIGTRIGFYFPEKAVALGRLIASVGQRDPIKVQRNPQAGGPAWKLVVGRHRLEGVRLEGLPLVQAIEVFGDAATLREMEASENLHRRPLAPIERAMFVFELCRAAQERVAAEHGNLTQQQLGAAARWAKVRDGQALADQALQDEAADAGDKMSSAYGWQESVAEALDLGPRTIKRSLRLYRLVIEPFPDLIEALAKHPVVGENDKQLRDIADLPGENQRRAVIEALLADPELSAEGARVQAGIVGDGVKIAPGHFDKFTGQIKTGWGRLNLQQRRAFVPEIAALMHTPELKRELRDRLNEELGE